eukprot:TRINITY_DN4077_c0_g1_i1.p1 TRINITY_DN4077_c0_g1~~TRINITY_DN4077_c0_g1_i1.p1  ORF type:complete len:1218 (-),score=412.55 TRINITY_DN4077_c0_g1_i1:1437-4568(-)
MRADEMKVFASQLRLQFDDELRTTESRIQTQLQAELQHIVTKRNTDFKFIEEKLIKFQEFLAKARADERAYLLDEVSARLADLQKDFAEKLAEQNTLSLNVVSQMQAETKKLVSAGSSRVACDIQKSLDDELTRVQSDFMQKIKDMREEALRVSQSTFSLEENMDNLGESLHLAREEDHTWIARELAQVRAMVSNAGALLAGGSVAADGVAPAVSVAAWLAQIGQARYADAFVAHGYTDTVGVAHLKEGALDAMGITLPGHRKAILAAVKELQSSGGAQPQAALAPAASAASLQREQEKQYRLEQQNKARLKLEQQQRDDELLFEQEKLERQKKQAQIKLEEGKMQEDLERQEQMRQEELRTMEKDRELARKKREFERTSAPAARAPKSEETMEPAFSWDVTARATSPGDNLLLPDKTNKQQATTAISQGGSAAVEFADVFGANARTEKERAERAEKERAERERAERERAERELAEKERVEKERAEKNERAERERAERERAERELAEKERVEKEKAEKERAEKNERAERERAERERAERELAEKERVEKEKAEKERAEKNERAERERAEKERAEKERAERERAEKEKAEKDHAERERAEKEQERKALQEQEREAEKEREREELERELEERAAEKEREAKQHEARRKEQERQRDQEKRERERREQEQERQRERERREQDQKRQEEEQRQREQEQERQREQEEHRKPVQQKHTPAAERAGKTGAEPEFDDEVVSAYEQIRDDTKPTNWIIMGYRGAHSNHLYLYGSGQGGTDEFVSGLQNYQEVVYGYLRVQYGDTDRTKFIMITLVPDTLSGMAKAKATMHKPFVENYLKYFHTYFNISSPQEVTASTIETKLHTAGGANYGGGSTGSRAQAHPVAAPKQPPASKPAARPQPKPQPEPQSHAAKPQSKQQQAKQQPQPQQAKPQPQPQQAKSQPQPQAQAQPSSSSPKTASPFLERFQQQKEALLQKQNLTDKQTEEKVKECVEAMKEIGLEADDGGGYNVLYGDLNDLVDGLDQVLKVMRQRKMVTHDSVLDAESLVHLLPGF